MSHTIMSNESPTKRTSDRSMHNVAIPGVGQVYFNMHPYYLTISEEFRTTYSFDADGRFLMGFVNGMNYHKSLEGAIMMKYFDEQRIKIRKLLTPSETTHLLDDLHTRVQTIRTHLVPRNDIPAPLLPWLDDILTWDIANLHEEQRRFASVYRPIPILPPDHYFSIVLQITEGCTWNQCTFCSFYRDRRFRVKPAHEVREHIRQIKGLFGRSIGLRKSIFLADANALIIPQPRLIELLKIIHAEFPLDAPPDHDYALDGIYSFLDIFGAERKTHADYEELRDYGVKRIYIGLETGDPDLFALLNKPGSPQECVDVVRTIKAAGLDVGVMLLVGAGGDRFYHHHVMNSVATLAQMPLDSGDIVYLSPLVVSAQSDYAQQMAEHRVRILSRAEVMAQLEIIKSLLNMRRPDRPRVTLYDIEEFLY